MIVYCHTRWLATVTACLVLIYRVTHPYTNLIGGNDLHACLLRMQETLNQQFMAHANLFIHAVIVNKANSCLSIGEIKGSNSSSSFPFQSHNAKRSLMVQKVNCTRVIHALLMAKLEPIVVSCWVFLIQGSPVPV